MKSTFSGQPIEKELRTPCLMVSKENPNIIILVTTTEYGSYNYTKLTNTHDVMGEDKGCADKYNDMGESSTVLNLKYLLEKFDYYVGEVTLYSELAPRLRSRAFLFKEIVKLLQELGFGGHHTEYSLLEVLDDVENLEINGRILKPGE